MIKEILAKTLLTHYKKPDTWFGIKYNMNLYRGCQHQCIYCDSRSECYQIENFKDIHIKANAVELLKKELASKREIGTIGTGAMNDPYMPIEKEVNLTGRALGVIAKAGFPVHVLTKSDLVLKDLSALKEISQIFAAVSFTITTADDDLGKKVEPGAPLVSRRFKAMKFLADNGIYTGITMMPILPFIEDNQENISNIVRLAKKHGAKYIIASFGLTLRDRQRAYYYQQLDKLFPGLKEKYQQQFGNQYGCAANNAKELRSFFKDLCNKQGVATRMKIFKPKKKIQTSLF